LLILVVMVGGYRYGLPVMATFAANRLPPRVEQVLGRQVLDTLDGPILQPTRLPMAAQARLTAGFDHLRRPAGSRQPDRIVFRSSAALGANAVALPSGDIILTDALVTLARDDEEILGVLAHEAGHVAARHGIRQLLQSSMVALFVTWFLGDISTLAATAPTALLQAKYSRDFEREADDYAADALRRNGIAPGRLADLLERLEVSRPGGGAAPSPIGYLSTHPATADRLQRLRTTSPAPVGRPRS
jgi:Zn-dependent protease with chaperone function